MLKFTDHMAEDHVPFILTSIAVRSVAHDLRDNGRCRYKDIAVGTADKQVDTGTGGMMMIPCKPSNVVITSEIYLTPSLLLIKTSRIGNTSFSTS